MAAAGLNVCSETTSKKQKDHYVIALVEFAFAMQSVLESINKDCFNDFKLRVGINVGPVVAGVIGVSKPHYDIWGNTVNVAARMDTTGHLNRIQVPEETRNILIEYGYACESRGNIYVKGKGDMSTYFVNQKL
jgi:adenylate cyclase 2